MSVVGLSFGSPTSGQGFDVSSTVASIVSNLQNVETPWKTQLSKLQKQDTTISNLGSLLSSLSNSISTLTDVTGIMSYKTGSSSDTSVLELTNADSTASAGTHTVVVKNLATSASGYFDKVTNASDTLSGSVTIKVGSGTSKTITLDSTNNTLAGLAKAINNSGAGVTATVLADASGSRLSLVSATSGSSGQITLSGTITDVTNSNTTLAYNPKVTGTDANLEIDGIPLTSSSNTVTGLIPGITFQILKTSSSDSSGNYTPVQVVIGNNTSGVESTLVAFVSNYNALVSAIDVQEGMDSSGNAEPLFGSPTLSMLQQQLLSSLNVNNPSGYLDAIGANTGTTLSGSVALQLAGGFTLGYTGTDGSDGTASSGTLSPISSTSDTLSGSISIATANGFALDYTGTAGTDSVASTGTLTSIRNASDTLSGSISIQVGSGTAQTITLDASNNTLAGLQKSINDAKMGVTASIVTNSDGTSSLSLVSDTTGAAGTLTVTSSVKDTSAQTIKLDSSNNTLDGLKTAINNAHIGVTASIVTNSSDGTSSLSLVSNTTGVAGAMTVTSSVKDTSAQTVAVNSSDNTLDGLAKSINSRNLGITATVVTKNNTSYLMLDENAGTTGKLSMTPNLTATSNAPLSFTDAGYSTKKADSGTLTKVAANTDKLAGSVTIQVGSGTQKTITLDSSNNTVAGLAKAINDAQLGVTASLNSEGTQITLSSGTVGAEGKLTITSNLLDTSDQTTSTLGYNTSSNFSFLSSLGLTASPSADGTLSLDLSKLDSVLNSDFSSVTGFFQNVNSWGSNFSSVLNNAGTSSSKGMLALALGSNSSTESILNANISRQESLISAESKSLLAVMISANEVLQAIPQQLSEVNMLYSAITGYNKSS